MNVNLFHLLVVAGVVLVAVSLYLIIAYQDKYEITCPMVKEVYRKKRQVGYILLAIGVLVLGASVYFRSKLEETVLIQRGNQNSGLDEANRLARIKMKREAEAKVATEQGIEVVTDPADRCYKIRRDKTGKVLHRWEDPESGCFDSD